ncbi:MAG: glycosyltransferase family 9 protein [Archangium sp.]
MKSLERLAKVLLAIVMAALLWRPGRRSRALRALADQKKRRVLVVRIDNRVGEALLTTPLLDALHAAGHEVHLLTHPKMRRVLAGHPSISKVWDWERNLTVLSALRAEKFDVVINCGNWAEPAVTSSLVARLINGIVIGPANFPSGWLMDVPVAPRTDTQSEFIQRAHLGSPLVTVADQPRLSFKPTEAFTVVDGRYAVINPGGRLGWRRVPPERFADAARSLVKRGVTPVVTWGPGEEALVDEVCAKCPEAVRAPPTSIAQLASLMRGAVVTVCNNTGPMHLSVAVGCKTLALFLHMDVARWGHDYAPHQMVDLTNATDATALIDAAVERAC